MIYESCFKEKTSMQEYIHRHFEEISSPFTGGIELTGNCNLKCVHCYAESYRNHKTRKLTLDNIKKIIDQWVDMGLLEVFLTGGEALTRKDFKEIYKYIRTRGVFISLLTNATLIDDDLIQLFQEYPISLISITMYGYTKETYEKVTQTPGSFQNFKNAIQLLKTNDIPFELKTIGLTINYHEIRAIREYAKFLGVNCRSGFDIRPMNDGNKFPLQYRVSPEDAFKLDISDDKRREFWEQIAKNPSPQIDSQNRRNCGYLYPCNIAKQFAFITADGYLRGCVKSCEYQYDIINGTFTDGWKALKENIVDKKASGNFVCLSCEKFRYCEQCTSNFILENHNAEQPVEFYCRVAEYRKQYVESYRQRNNIDTKTDSWR